MTELVLLLSKTKPRHLYMQKYFHSLYLRSYSFTHLSLPKVRVIDSFTPLSSLWPTWTASSSLQMLHRARLLESQDNHHHHCWHIDLQLIYSDEPKHYNILILGYVMIWVTLHGIRVSSHGVFIWEKRAGVNRGKSLEDVLEKIRSMPTAARNFQYFKGFAVNV